MKCKKTKKDLEPCDGTAFEEDKVNMLNEFGDTEMLMHRIELHCNGFNSVLYRNDYVGISGLIHRSFQLASNKPLTMKEVHDKLTGGVILHRYNDTKEQQDFWLDRALNK